MEKNEKCPYCGSEKNVIGRQNGYACITANKALTFKEQKIFHIICLNCGTVIRSFVKKPEKLLTKKDK